jgi:secreted Zn-dependent insulinase-like peptidase
MRVVVVSNTVEEKCVMTEKWYGTKYFQERIPAVWSNVICWSTTAVSNVNRVVQAQYESWLFGPIDPALQVPKPNPFIATDFTLRNSVIEVPSDDIHSDDIKPSVPASVEAVLGTPLFPRRCCDFSCLSGFLSSAVARARTFSPITVRDNDTAMVLFVPDTLFGLPRLECQFWLRLPPTYNSPAATVMTALFVKLVNVCWADVDSVRAVCTSGFADFCLVLGSGKTQRACL